MSDASKKISRAEFIKRTAVGAAATAVALKLGNVNVMASEKNNSESQHIGPNPPSNTNITWVDTSSNGVLKYFNGKEWVPTKAVWG